MDNSPYNPLDKLNLGRSVSDALLATPIRALNANSTAEIVGAGIYAIYYTGEFSPYQPISSANSNGQFAQPIYVGKAIPKGGRKGGLDNDAGKGSALRDRLNQHASSIVESENLHIEDFAFRCIVVDDIWIPLGENMVIQQFRPIWNLVIDGFGNKDPGNRRATQYRSPWDVLHPGRRFAVKLADSPSVSPESLVQRIERFHAGSLPEAVLVGDPEDA